MTSDGMSGISANDQECANLFIAALAGEYGGSDDLPYYGSVVLSGQPETGHEMTTLVAYSAVYDTIEVDRLKWRYFAFSSQVQVQTHTQLMMALLRHEAPDSRGPQSAMPHDATQIKQFHRALFASGLLSSPLRLPAFAVVQLATESGEECVEFLAPHKVNPSALISYMQYGYGAFWG